MIDRHHKLALTKQAALLGISRGSVYYEPAPVSAADLALMRRLDELHLEFPFAGARMLRGLLAAEGSKVGRRHVTTLMRRMGIEAIYRRPNTSKPAPGHRIYPYLLRGLMIDRPNLRWSRNFAQGVKWNLGLTAGMLCLRIRSDDEEASPPEPHTGLQGEGGLGCLEE